MCNYLNYLLYLCFKPVLYTCAVKYSYTTISTINLPGCGRTFVCLLHYRSVTTGMYQVSLSDISVESYTFNVIFCRHISTLTRPTPYHHHHQQQQQHHNHHHHHHHHHHHQHHHHQHHHQPNSFRLHLIPLNFFQHPLISSDFPPPNCLTVPPLPLYLLYPAYNKSVTYLRRASHNS